MRGSWSLGRSLEDGPFFNPLLPCELYFSQRLYTGSLIVVTANHTRNFLRLRIVSLDNRNSRTIRNLGYVIARRSRLANIRVLNLISGCAMDWEW